MSIRETSIVLGVVSRSGECLDYVDGLYRKNFVFELRYFWMIELGEGLNTSNLDNKSNTMDSIFSRM